MGRTDRRDSKRGCYLDSGGGEALARRYTKYRRSLTLHEQACAVAQRSSRDEISVAMTHIAIQEELNGKAVEWMEKVTDEQYRK